MNQNFDKSSSHLFNFNQPVILFNKSFTWKSNSHHLWGVLSQRLTVNKRNGWISQLQFLTTQLMWRSAAPLGGCQWENFFLAGFIYLRIYFLIVSLLPCQKISVNYFKQLWSAIKIKWAKEAKICFNKQVWIQLEIFWVYCTPAISFKCIKFRSVPW